MTSIMPKKLIHLLIPLAFSGSIAVPLMAMHRGYQSIEAEWSQGRLRFKIENLQVKDAKTKSEIRANDQQN
jgi:hypothetical protein